MKDNLWYKKQLIGLKYIVEDDGGMIARSYITEKLDLILNEQGINFHPLIRETLEEVKE